MEREEGCVVKVMLVETLQQTTMNDTDHCCLAALVYIFSQLHFSTSTPEIYGHLTNSDVSCFHWCRE